MGVSTDAILCYGFSFEAGFEFPWDSEVYNGDYEEWWEEVRKFDPPVQLFGDNGEWLPGMKSNIKARMLYDKYVHHWNKENPFPVELVTHCSGSHPMFIIASRDSVYESYRGYPILITPTLFTVSKEQKNAVLQFCRTYNIKTAGEPQWWLCSFWEE